MRTMHRMATVFRAIMVAGVGCENHDSVGSPEPLHVSVAPKLDTLLVGATKQLTARVYDARDQTREHTVDWRSENPAVATVSSSGMVAAVSAGVAYVTVSAGGPADTATV